MFTGWSFKMPYNSDISANTQQKPIKKGVPHSPYSRRQLYIHHRKNRLSTHRSISRNTAIHNQQSRHRTQCSRKLTNGSLASIKTILPSIKQIKKAPPGSLLYFIFHSPPLSSYINTKIIHHPIIHHKSHLSHHLRQS